MKWSPNQNNVFDFVENQKGNALIEAVAGSEKTTTIAEAVNRVPFGYKTIFLAFNKAIAEELKSIGVNARTFHSLTFMPVKNATNFKNIESNKTRNVIGDMFSRHEIGLYGSFVSKLVGLAKQAGIGALTPMEDRSLWMDLVNHHGLYLESNDAVFSDAITYSIKALKTSNIDYKRYGIDFNDLLYYPLLMNLTLPKHDFIFVDEAQDTNGIQREILRKIMKPTSRLICVGDPAQAIYGFRGSDSNSLNVIQEEFDCKSLPLTISYRCPKKVVQYAQQWVSHIQSHESAPDGKVTDLGKNWKTEDILPGDMIVCRTVKPLVQLAFSMLSAHVTTPQILGKEIGGGLVSLIKTLNASDLTQLEEKLDKWKDNEVDKARKKNQEEKVESILDKYEIIDFLARKLDDDNQTIQGLIDFINSLFEDKSRAAILCTIHKAKGLENEKVYWLNRSQCPHPMATKPWQIQQELNLCYVAATRAKEELVLIEQ